MPYAIKFCDHIMLSDTLNGARVLGPFTRDGLPIGGKTLVFSDPSATVTFPGEEGSVVTFGDVARTLREQVPDLRVEPRRHRANHGDSAAAAHFLSISRDKGFTLGGDGTANEALGFSGDEELKNTGLFPKAQIQAVGLASPGLFFLITSPAE